MLLSELTKAWLLYLGLFFVLMVMYAPGGVASLLMMNLRVAAFGKLRAPVDGLPGARLAGLVMLAGVGAMIEMVYHLQLNAALGPQLRFLGVTLERRSAEQLVRRRCSCWAPGWRCSSCARRRSCVELGARSQEEIENEIKRREALA